MKSRLLKGAVSSRQIFSGAVRAGTTALLIISLSGCACIKENSLTGKVWNGEQLCDYRTVSKAAPVEVFQLPDADEYLLTYTETDRDGSKLRRRAYLVRRNADATARGERPHFVDSHIEGLVSIPVNTATTNLPRASVTHELSLFTADGRLDTYALPKYKRDSATPAQVALTPLSVTGDVAITAGVVTLVGALLWLSASADCDSDYEFK